MQRLSLIKFLIYHSETLDVLAINYFWAHIYLLTYECIKFAQLNSLATQPNDTYTIWRKILNGLFIIVILNMFIA